MTADFVRPAGFPLVTGGPAAGGVTLAYRRLSCDQQESQTDKVRCLSKKWRRSQSYLKSQIRGTKYYFSPVRSAPTLHRHGGGAINADHGGKLHEGTHPVSRASGSESLRRRRCC